MTIRLIALLLLCLLAGCASAERTHWSIRVYRETLNGVVMQLHQEECKCEKHKED